MSMKQAGGNRKPGGGPAAASGAGGGGGTGGRQSLGRGRNSVKAPSSAAIAFNGVYANMRMVHVLTSVVGTKCELKVKNGVVYEGVFKTYGPECDLVLDAAHRKSPDNSLGPRREDIVESIMFKASDVVVVQFKDVDLNYARKDNFTDSAVSSRINGEHKEKDLEPWDAGESASESLEALETDVSNGWDPNDMFKFNEENYGVKSTYDSSLSSYTVPLERDNSEEFLKREARAAQLAEEIESSATYKARVALENDDRSEEEKFTAVARTAEREGHSINSRENKYIPPGQRNRDGIPWGTGRQNSPRLVQGGSGPPPPRSGPHDYSPSSGGDQRVVNGGVPWPSPCPSPSSRPPSRYQSGPTSLPPRAATPTRPPSRPPSRPSRPPSHPSSHGSPAPVSTMPKRMSTEGPPRMSPKTQRTPRIHRATTGRGSVPGADFMSHNASSEVSSLPARSSPSGGSWSQVVSGGPTARLSPKAHRARQNSIGSASSGSSLPSPQAGTVPMEPVAMPVSAVSPATASPASNRAVTPSAEAKESRVQETRQNSPAANKENIKPIETSPSIARPVSKGPPTMAPDQRKQIDNLKKFSVDFRLQPSSTSDPVFDQMISKPRDPGEKPKELHLEKSLEPGCKDSASEDSSVTNTTGSSSSSSKPGSPSTSPSGLCSAEQKRGPDVTSQGVQTSGPGSKLDKDEKDDKKDTTPEQVRKSTLNPNAKEFNPRSFCAQPKPATTPTPPRPQGQPSPIVVQQPPTVYSQTVCFPQMYPLPVSPGVQVSGYFVQDFGGPPPTMYHVPVTPMTVNQTKSYRAGKVPSMPQQRPDQHHPQGTPTMMHPATAAGPPIVAPSPAYSAQYFTCSPQQFTNQALVQQVPHYQSQAQHVFSPVMQGSARMMAPPSHGQPGLVSSSTSQYGPAEQTHTMYVSQGPIPQQYPHPNATLHPHPQHPQPSATPTGQQQQQGQHTGSHPAPSPVQHAQHQAAQALHLGNPPQQPMYSTLTPTPPSMTPGPNPQSPQTSFPSAQQAVYIHPQQVQHGYNPSHMAHVPQAHVQSGMVPPHHATPTHPPMMLMATQPPGGPQPPIPQNTLPPIPVSSTTHFSYMTHPSVQPHHQQQL